MSDVQYRLDAGRPQQTVEQTNRLLRTVAEIQLNFIREKTSLSWCGEALQAFLDVTDSEYGFIGELQYDADGDPRLQTHAISDRADNRRSQKFDDSSLPRQLQPGNLQTIIGDSILTGELLISNDPLHDSRPAGLPDGHPALTSLMAIPLRLDDQFVGMAVFANRPNGYTAALADWLEPLIATCATLMVATDVTKDRVTRETDARDITDWKETQNALHESRERLRAIIESTPECVKLVAPDGTLLEMNAAGLRMIKAESADAALGLNVFDLIAPEYRSKFIAFHDRVCGGESGSMQFELVGLKGGRRWMETHAVPLNLSPDGETVHLAITRDITAAREAEETIAQQQTQLIHVSRLSSMGQMVAVISHEITQPLAAISNFASACSLIAQRPDPDHQKLGEYLEAITEQSIRAGQIIGRVRDFVRRSDDHQTVCNLIQLVADSLTLVKADLRRHRVTMEADLPDHAIDVLADSVQIQQVVVNLISNACDAMVSQPVSRRRIWIRLADSNDQPSVEILDDGPGLTEGTQDKIFDPFYTSKPNGMGMGLTICSDIVKSHFGTITARNEPNHGALIRFTLPRPKESANG